MKHPHAELIHAWADGAKIEIRPVTGSENWYEVSSPNWNNEYYEYRIKAKPKQVVTSKCWRNKDNGVVCWSNNFTIYDGWERFPAGDITGEVE